jgi:hypothetical protein
MRSRPRHSQLLIKKNLYNIYILYVVEGTQMLNFKGEMIGRTFITFKLYNYSDNLDKENQSEDFDLVTKFYLFNTRVCYTYQTNRLLRDHLKACCLPQIMSIKNSLEIVLYKFVVLAVARQNNSLQMVNIWHYSCHG